MSGYDGVKLMVLCAVVRVKKLTSQLKTSVVLRHCKKVN